MRGSMSAKARVMAGVTAPGGTADRITACM
jgi:hypothetical protein